MRKNGGKIKIVGKQNNKNYRDCDKDINIEKKLPFLFYVVISFSYNFTAGNFTTEWCDPENRRIKEFGIDHMFQGIVSTVIYFRSFTIIFNIILSISVSFLLWLSN